MKWWWALDLKDNKEQPEKNFNLGLKGVQTHDLCDIPVQHSNLLSYQANGQLVIQECVITVF